MGCHKALVFEGPCPSDKLKKLRVHTRVSNSGSLGFGFAGLGGSVFVLRIISVSFFEGASLLWHRLESSQSMHVSERSRSLCHI